MAQSLMIVILSVILLVIGSHQKLERCLWDMGGVQ
jgi:Sec-independent protein translocase protein TatA